MRQRTWTFVVVLALIAAACSGGGGGDATSSTSDGGASSPSGAAAPVAGEVVRINELQVVGSHNSYHLAPDGGIAEALAALAPEFWHQLDYTHASLTEQLADHGIRQLEIDVFADPDGGHYRRREALSLVGEEVESGIEALDEPGFKVMHIQDFDFRTTCLTLVACLDEVDAWSRANPRHVPVMIFIETKVETLAEGAEGIGIDIDAFDVTFTDPVQMTAALFDDLEGEILSVFGRDRIIAPDDVRGDHERLDDAVAAGGWPTLDDARGKVLFALIDRGAVADLYRTGAPALEGRLLFTSVDAGEPDAAVLRIDDPTDAAAIAAALEHGYLVRTRADTPTFEARSGDTARLDAALASGAQYVSTDFYPGRATESDYAAMLPGGVAVRCSPAAAGDACADADLSE